MFPSGEGFCPPITGEPKGVIAGYVTKNEGNRCAPRTCFQCENDTNRLYKIILNTYLICTFVPQMSPCLLLQCPVACLLLGRLVVNCFGHVG